jgi:hypothetical protein
VRCLAFALLLLSPAAALGQAADETRARALRDEARLAASDGRLEAAFELLRTATQQTADPVVWLEVAEVADRLRLDQIALQAYEAYLERRPDAPDRGEIRGRVRVLREIVSGNRFVLEGDTPYITQRSSRVLVDWYGRPLVLRRTGIIMLHDFFDDAAPAPRRMPDLLPFPSPGRRSLARELSVP